MVPELNLRPPMSNQPPIPRSEAWSGTLLGEKPEDLAYIWEAPSHAQAVRKMYDTLCTKAEVLEANRQKYSRGLTHGYDHPDQVPDCLRPVTGGITYRIARDFIGELCTDTSRGASASTVVADLSLYNQWQRELEMAKVQGYQERKVQFPDFEHPHAKEPVNFPHRTRVLGLTLSASDFQTWPLALGIADSDFALGLSESNSQTQTLRLVLSKSQP